VAPFGFPEAGFTDFKVSNTNYPASFPLECKK
jgi:hypothetical protein